MGMNLKNLKHFKRLVVKKEVSEEIIVNEMKVEDKPFRLCRKKYFLTFSQCDVCRKHMVYFLLNKFPVENYLVCQEFHADGNQHLHVYFNFKKKYS
jgi:Geminivirus Rep catalytic domain